MKVLITTDWYRPVINGVVTSVVSLADGLTALGCEVRILTLSGDRHSRTEGNVTYLGSIGVGKIYPNARLKTAPSSKYVRELIAWRPDVVHSQCEFSTFFLARKIAEACDCPLVHTYHTVYEDFTHYFSPSVRFGKYMAAAFSRRILAKTDFVIVPTGKIEALLRRYGVKTPLAVIPSGLELTPFETPLTAIERSVMRESVGVGQNDKVLLFLGRLAQEKNIDELLEFVGRQNDPHVKLMLVGDGPYRAQLEARAAALRLGERVIFTGMVKPCEAARYYALGDIFLSASQSETQGLTYIEAMAAGLPLLCRADPCLAGVIRGGANGLTYTDEDDFAAKLCRLLDDSCYRRTLGRAARETAFRRFSAGSFARSVLSEYQKLLCARRERAGQAARSGKARCPRRLEGGLMNERSKKILLRGISAAGLLLSVALCVYGWQKGIFASQEKLQAYIDGFGAAGAAVFIVFQAVQVVVPVLPGGLGCLAGVLLFGAWKGFFYNYIGICIGSVLAFLAAKYYGRPILRCLFSEKLVVKYEKWTSEKNRFAKMFALAIFLPVAPDDFLCYLAGTTEMSLARFTAIILLGKPFAIALYSMGLMAVFSRIPAMIGG